MLFFDDIYAICEAFISLIENKSNKGELSFLQDVKNISSNDFIGLFVLPNAVHESIIIED